MNRDKAICDTCNKEYFIDLSNSSYKTLHCSADCEREYFRRILDNNLKEIKAKKQILKFFSLFGLDKDIKNIIGESDKKPVITFKADTKEDYLRIMELLKHDTLNIYLEEHGTTGFKPITKHMVIKETDNIKLIDSKYLLETKTDKYILSGEYIKIRFFIPYNDIQTFDIWLEVNLNLFPKDFYYRQEIVDTYETEQAKQYNHRHKDIMTNRVIFNNLETIKFYGGHTTHYTTDNKLTDWFMKLLFLEVV